MSRREDLTKLHSVLSLSFETNFNKIVNLFGYDKIINPRSQMMDPNYLLMDINPLVDDETKERFYRLRDNLNTFSNISSYYIDLFKNDPISIKLDYLNFMGEFLTAIIKEAEKHFISADSIYEKMAISYPEISISINKRRNRILPMVVNEFFGLYPTFNKINNAHVLIDKEFPLIITGITPGPGNYLEYNNQPVRIVSQKYPMPQFKILGEVLGPIKTSCILPRVVFWGKSGYLGETVSKYSVNGKFDINFSFSIPDGTIDVTPRITFDASCFRQGQRILVENFFWSSRKNIN